MTDNRSNRASLAALLLGIGMGGFVDGIVLHQLLQWHNMLSNRISPDTMDGMRINMVWDGVFHAAVWVVTLLGVFLLHSAALRRAAIPTGRAFVGYLVLGWGLFNLVEGVINHQILALHFVRQVPNHTVYNLTFLAIGGLFLMGIGWWLVRSGHNDTPRPPQRSWNGRGPARSNSHGPHLHRYLGMALRTLARGVLPRRRDARSRTRVCLARATDD